MAISKNSNDQQYIWTVQDVRTLDKRLERINQHGITMKEDIADIKKELAVKNHIVVDNSGKTDWKAIGTIAVAVIGALGTLYITIKGGI